MHRSVSLNRGSKTVEQSLYMMMKNIIEVLNIHIELFQNPSSSKGGITSKDNAL